MITRYPTYVPMILERGTMRLPNITRDKFLLSEGLTGAQLQYIVRRRLNMTSAEALFLLLESGRMIPPDAEVRALHNEFRNLDDGFLYARYTTEDAFG